MRLRQLFENQGTAVMAFGRMNPPTIGHAKLVDAIKSQPGDPYLFLSQSQKPKTDPLAFEDKLRYAKFFFPNITIGNPEVKTIIQALQKIEQLGYKNLIYVAGSDRVASFEELINKYNGKDYNFDSIQVVSAGERDPDADGAEGMSASKMRQAAADNDIEIFKQGVPNKELADELFVAVRAGMGIGGPVSENINEAFEEGVPEKIEVKKPNAPRPPDQRIPRRRNGYTTNDGTTYTQDRYKPNIMHVENGDGKFSFDDQRLVKWQTPKFSGLQYTYDYVLRKITMDFTTTVKVDDAESVVEKQAVYDMKGNLIDKGSTSVSAGGLGTTVSDKEIKFYYTVSDNLSLHFKAKAGQKTSSTMDQIKQNLQSRNSGKPLEDLVQMARQVGAKVKFRSPARTGRAIPFRQGLSMLRDIESQR